MCCNGVPQPRSSINLGCCGTETFDKGDEGCCGINVYKKGDQQCCGMSICEKILSCLQLNITFLKF
jgi:hypothetical protein